MKFPYPAKAARPSLIAIRRLKKAGFAAYWVGGSVRDLLLKKKPKDFDIVTSARVPDISRLFPKHITVGKKFGIVIVTEFGSPLEIATFRQDLDYKDGRHPSGVRPASLEEDIVRRDFTVNGLLYDPARGELIDKVSGVKDLRRKLIRTIGKADERFREDHLRILRAIRFSVQLGFRIEGTTWQAIRRNAARLKRISVERIREELLKILASPEPDRGLVLLEQSGVLKVILPEVQKLKGVKQSKPYHPEGDVFRHTCLVVKSLPNAEPALLMAGLLHDIEKPSTRFRDKKGIHFYGHEVKGALTAVRILRRLKFSRNDQDRVDYMIRNHLRWFSGPEMRLTRLWTHMDHPYFLPAMELLRADIDGSNKDRRAYRYIMAQYKNFKKSGQKCQQLLLGRDLIAMGVCQGPIIGEILRAVEEKRQEEALKTPEEAKKWVEKTYFDKITP